MKRTLNMMLLTLFAGLGFTLVASNDGKSTRLPDDPACGVQSQARRCTFRVATVIPEEMPIARCKSRLEAGSPSANACSAKLARIASWRKPLE